MSRLSVRLLLLVVSTLFLVIGAGVPSLKPAHAAPSARQAPNSWVSVAPMPTARYDFAAAAGPDGRIHALGGINQYGAFLSTLEAYDPATNTWTEDTNEGGTLTPMPTARAGLAAATGVDGRIYAIGGTDTGDVLSTVEAYDPRTNTWATSGSGPGQIALMPTARTLLAAATGPDGRIYAIGGTISLNGGQFLNIVEAYDPRTNTWATSGGGPGQIAPLPTARGGLTAVTGADGRIYAIGGRANTYCGYTHSVCQTVEAYDTATNTWTTSGTGQGQTAPMPMGREYLGAATGPNGLIYAIGGYNPPYCATMTCANVEAYDTATNTWTTSGTGPGQTAPLPEPRSNLAVVPGADGRIYAIGGEGNVGLLSTVDAYQVSNTCLGVALSASPPSPAETGTRVSLSASASGCSQPLYQFYVLPQGGGWTALGPYSSSATATWNTSGVTPGAAQLAVWAKDASSTGAYDTFAILNPYTLTSTAQCSSAVLSVAPAGGAVVGQTLTLSAAAGGCPSPQYQFWVLSPGGAWQALGNGYQSAASIAFPTTGLVPGAYDLAVWTREAGSSAPYEAYAILPNYALSPPCASVTLALSPATRALPGQGVNVTATTKGGSANCLIEFWLETPTTGWMLVQPYSSNTG